MEYNGANTILARYVHGQGAGVLRRAQDDRPLVRYVGVGNSTDITNARFLHTDRLGSVIYETDRYGANTRYWAHDDYGAVDQTPPHALGRFGYTGQTWLPELGLWYYKPVLSLSKGRGCIRPLMAVSCRPTPLAMGMG